MCTYSWNTLYSKIPPQRRRPAAQGSPPEFGYRPLEKMLQYCILTFAFYFVLQMCIKVMCGDIPYIINSHEIKRTFYNRNTPHDLLICLLKKVLRRFQFPFASRYVKWLHKENEIHVQVFMRETNNDSSTHINCRKQIASKHSFFLPKASPLS